MPGEKTALQLAFEEWRAEHDENERAVQPDLFGEPGTSLMPRGPGRPPGARNKATDETLALIRARCGGREPLEVGFEISGMPIAEPGVAQELARRWQCKTHEALKAWISIYTATIPYFYPRLGSIELTTPGAPGSGSPVAWHLDGQAVEIGEKP